MNENKTNHQQSEKRWIQKKDTKQPSAFSTSTLKICCSFLVAIPARMCCFGNQSNNRIVVRRKRKHWPYKLLMFTTYYRLRSATNQSKTKQNEEGKQQQNWHRIPSIQILDEFVSISLIFASIQSFLAHWTCVTRVCLCGVLCVCVPFLLVGLLFWNHPFRHSSVSLVQWHIKTSKPYNYYYPKRRDSLAQA